MVHRQLMLPTRAEQHFAGQFTDSEREINQQVSNSYSRTQENEIQQTFPRLPNPDMVMYVFPHLAGGNTPVPGYSTVFPFYSQVQYALPGERTEDL